VVRLHRRRLVFPSFLFAVGCAMSFAFQRPTTGRAFAAKVLRRAGLIFPGLPDVLVPLRAQGRRRLGAGADSATPG
jgi:hypothetical protein